MSRRPGSAPSGRGEAGFGLVETVIALALLALIIVPITRLIVDHRRRLEQLAPPRRGGRPRDPGARDRPVPDGKRGEPDARHHDHHRRLGQGPLHGRRRLRARRRNGSSSSICIAPPGQPSSRIWTVKATVNWGNGAQRGHVIETTLDFPLLGRSRRHQRRRDRRAGLQRGRLDVRDDLDADQHHGHGYVRRLAVLGRDGPEQREDDRIGQHRLDAVARCSPICLPAPAETYNITATPPSPYVDPNELFYNSTGEWRADLVRRLGAGQ